jgi:hypothetical protein
MVAATCFGLLHRSNKLSVPALEPKIPLGANFEVALVFARPGQAVIF